MIMQVRKHKTPAAAAVRTTLETEADAQWKWVLTVAVLGFAGINEWAECRGLGIMGRGLTRSRVRADQVYLQQDRCRRDRPKDRSGQGEEGVVVRLKMHRSLVQHVEIRLGKLIHDMRSDRGLAES
jgi:hypothetical protein